MMRPDRARPEASLLPVDRVFIFFNVVLALALSPLAAAEPGARPLLGAHLLALLLPGVLARGHRPNRPWLAVLRECYPVLCLPLFWRELGLRYAWIDTTANDRIIADLEQMIFGFQPSMHWSGSLPDRWMVEAMSAWYGSYYVLLAAIPLLVLAAGQRSRLRELVYRVSLTYLACFLLYTVFPVAGPREFFIQARGVPGWFGLINDSIRSVGDSLGTAFPSSHVAGSLTLAWIAWRTCSRVVFWSSGLAAAGMAVAVVFTRNHFVLDAVAAVILVGLVQGIVAPALEDRWMAPASPPTGVPPAAALGPNPAEQAAA